jgi:chorismate mutase
MLEKYRKQLDKIDNNIIGLIKERTIIIKKVAQYKKENNIPRLHTQREKELIEEKKAIAIRKKLDPKTIEEIFKKIIKYSHIIQKRIIGK